MSLRDKFTDIDILTLLYMEIMSKNTKNKNKCSALGSSSSLTH